MSSTREEISGQFARTLVFWRERRGMTARALADAAGVKPPHISRMENGTALPSVPVLLQLAAGLGIHPGVLLLAPESALDVAKLMESATEALRAGFPSR